MTSPLASTVTERDWHGFCATYAEWNGWWCFHDLDPRKNRAGFPDLMLCRNGELIFAELKTEKGKVSPSQQRVLDLLEAVPGIEVYVWRPSDQDFVMERLGRKR